MSEDTALNGAGTASSGIADGYPATALIKALLEHYKSDFTNYQRHQKLSKALLDEWKFLYDAVLDHVKIVNDENGAYQAQWDSFIKYSNAIEPLEKSV